MITRAACGLGTSLTVTSVTTPSIPSEPMKTASKSRPGASRPSLPSSTTSPSVVTIRTRSTLCTVRPYFRQCTPPEFSATLPPIEQAIRRFRNSEVAHTGLDHGGARIRIEPDDAVQARSRQHDAIGNRRGATGQACACAARHDGHLQAAADLQCGNDLRFILGQHDHHRQLPIGRQAIAFVGTGIFLAVQHGLRRQHRAQGGDHSLLARQRKGRRSGFVWGVHDVGSGRGRP